MHRTIYQILRDTGRRPGEVVSLRIDCLEVIDGQHNLIYDNHKAGRLRRRLPITSETAELVMTWQARRSQLLTPPATGARLAVPEPACCGPNKRTGTSHPRASAGPSRSGSAEIDTITANCSDPTDARPRSTGPRSRHTHCATPTRKDTPTPEYPSTCSKS